MTFRKTISFALLIGVSITLLIGQSLKANLKYSLYYTPDGGPYIETTLFVDGTTVTYMPVDDGEKVQGAVNLSILFQQNDTVTAFSKLQITSPKVDTVEGKIFDFMDVQRFQMPNGTYEMVVQIADNAHPDRKYEHAEPITVYYSHDSICTSAIAFIDVVRSAENEQERLLAKGGYYLIPKITSFYPEEIDNLTFYYEVYNLTKRISKGDPLVIRYYLQSAETKQLLNSFAKQKILKANDIIPQLNTINITDLPSGNYELVIEVRDDKNQLITKSESFLQRSNPRIAYDLDALSNLEVKNNFVANYTNIDTLRMFTYYLYPRATTLEKQFIFRHAKKSDLLTLQRFFYNFWKERKPDNPYRAWIDYKKLVDVVNHQYKAVGMQGFQTDRGRVYLQYGPPNTIVDRVFDTGSSGIHVNKDGSDSDLGGTVPYQIWHYYQLSDNQRDKRFVFANPQLATNAYNLIHSDAYGELYNPQWQSELQRQTFKSTNLDETGTFKGESGDFYHVPY